MNVIAEILKKIGFTENFNLDENQFCSKVEDLTPPKEFNLKGLYIDKYKYLSRQNEEFWRSLDIYINIGKEDEVLLIINKCLEENNLDEIPKSIVSSEDILHRVDINKNYKISFVKNKGFLVVQIINFYTA